MPRWKKLREKWIRSTRAGLSWRKRKTDYRGTAGLLGETKSNDCISSGSGVFFELFQQCGFQIAGIRIHLAGGNFLIRCAVETEFAYSQSIFGTNRRPKTETSHRTAPVEFAISGCRIECRAGLIVCEVRKTSLRFVPFVQQPG